MGGHIVLKVKSIGFVFFTTLILFLLLPVTSFAEKALVIDSGHGGRFSGTCGYTGNKTGYCEKDANLDVALKLRDQLKGSGIKVYLTRNTDSDFASYLRGEGGDFEKRMQIANGFAKENNNNSVFISIHHNAHPRSPYVKGIETYYYDGVNHAKADWPHDPLQIKYLADNKRLAEFAHSDMVSKIRAVDRGVQNDQSFYVIRNAQMPAILVELGYMTNPDEERRIKSSSGQTNAAKALAEAVKKYFKVFEVYDSAGNRLATFQSKNDAINYTNKQTKLVRVFDKDKQTYVYSNSNYIVYHKTNGYLNEFATENDAKNFANDKPNTRIVRKDRNWTVWSNYLPENYKVYVNGVLYHEFYDYHQALEYAEARNNSKLVRVSSSDVLWTNISGEKVTKNTSVRKLSGSYRSTTSIEISKYLYPNGFSAEKEQKVAIITTGYDPADALSSGPLTRVYDGAPILLTESSKLDVNVNQELKRLGAQKVIIVGGMDAVSESIEKEIKSLGITTERLNGRDRYETNKFILDKLGNVNGYFVASGTSYPDALVSAPIAAAQNWGIVLTDKNSITSSALSKLKGKETVIVGGDAVISGNVESKVKSATSNVTRLAGYGRYRTLAEVLWHFNDELKSESILLSTGNNYPDALTSASLAIGLNSPLILTDKELDRNVESYLQEYGIKNNVKEVKVIGGTLDNTVVSDVVNKVK